MANRSFGWVRQPPDARDYLYTVPAYVVASLAAKEDLSAGMGDLLDQGNKGACGPNSAAEQIQYDDRVEGLPTDLPSRLFIYYATRDLMGTVGSDSGVDNRSMLKALNHSGFCLEKDWPYDLSKMYLKPGGACYTAALAHRIDTYAAVQQSLVQMKACISSGFPFLFGFDAFNSLLTDYAASTGIVLDPVYMETPVGGHDCVITGYDDAGFGKSGMSNGCFKFRNSWGAWGDQGQGWGYISYAYATNRNLAGDFWTINSVPKPAPPDPPQPPPQPNPCRRLASALMAFTREMGKE